MRLLVLITVQVAVIALTIAVACWPSGGSGNEVERLVLRPSTLLMMVSIEVVLTAYLLFRHRQRERQRPPELNWEGHGIDVTGITAQVQRLRSDFASELHSRPSDTGHRRGLLASAKRAVGRLAYFRRRAGPSSALTEHETETRAA